MNEFCPLGRNEGYGACDDERPHAAENAKTIVWHRQSPVSGQFSGTLLYWLKRFMLPMWFFTTRRRRLREASFS